jgi:hypothetical protein
MAGDFVQRFVRLRSHTTSQWLAAPELRPRLVEAAEEQGSNLTEVVIGILATTYKVPFEPNGRRTAPADNGEELNLRLPVRLDRSIGIAAARNGRSVPDEIRAALCEHYGLRIPAAA